MRSSALLVSNILLLAFAPNLQHTPSPLATASYRLLPHIKIKKPIPPELADKFQKCFSPGVIRVDPKTKAVSVDPKNVRRDTVSREVLRHPEFQDSVELSRVRDHFLCEFSLLGLCTKRLVLISRFTVSVESESAYAPEWLLAESIKILREKVKEVKAEALKLRDQDADSQSVADGDVSMEAA